MIRGNINKEFFKIEYDKGCKITTQNQDLKETLQDLRGGVFNPVTYETYYGYLTNNEFDAYLLISDLINYGFEITLSEYPKIESEPDVIY